MKKSQPPEKVWKALSQAQRAALIWLPRDPTYARAALADGTRRNPKSPTLWALEGHGLAKNVSGYGGEWWRITKAGLDCLAAGITVPDRVVK